MGNVSMVRGAALARRMARVALTCVLAMMVGGCAAVWPRMKSDTALASNCATAAGYGSGAAVDYGCVNAAIEELEGMQAQIGHYDLGVQYSAIVGGTYAGYLMTRAKLPNKAPLKNTGVALAALLGFDQATGAEARMTVLDAGVTALRCIRQTAVAIDVLKPPQDIDVRVAKGAFESRVQSVLQSQNLSEEEGKRLTTAVTLFQSMKVLEVTEATNKLATSISVAKASLPVQLYIAVTNVRGTVRSQLVAKRADLKTLFMQQRQSVVNMASDVQKAATEQKEKVQAASEMLSAPAAATETGNTKPVTTVFEDCAGG